MFGRGEDEFYEFKKSRGPHNGSGGSADEAYSCAKGDAQRNFPHAGSEASNDLFEAMPYSI